jgi:hypothetical protein
MIINSQLDVIVAPDAKIISEITKRLQMLLISRIQNRMECHRWDEIADTIIMGLKDRK